MKNNLFVFIVCVQNSLNMGSVAPSSFVATQPVGPGIFRSPMDDAYYYYGLQNPLDPNLGTGKHNTMLQYMHEAVKENNMIGGT